MKRRKGRLRSVTVLWKAAAILFTGGVLFASGLALALDVPPLTGRVIDRANMLSPQDEQQLASRLSELERTDSTQVVVLTISSLEGEVLEEYALKVAETWGLGQKDLDNGVLLLVAQAERRIRIEVGQGLEWRLTDLLAGRIIDQVITPAFRQGRYAAGLAQGAESIVQAVKGEYQAPANGKSGRRGSGRPWFFVFIFTVVVSVIVANATRKRFLGAAAGGVTSPLLGWVVLSLGLAGVLLLIPVGVVFGLLAASMFGPGSHRGGGGKGTGQGRRSGGGGFIFLPGGHWGGRSGGFGGGMGGLGGFSGGGGGFGGGGASGGW